MSENLLRLIIKLFAIIAKEDQVTTQEKRTIEDFLLEHLNEEKGQKFLQYFDQISTELEPFHHQDTHGGPSEEEYKELEAIGKEINYSLVQQQKRILMLYLIMLMVADEKVSAKEQKLVNYIGDVINVSNEEITQLRTLVTSEQTEDFDSENILIIDDHEEFPGDKVKHSRANGLQGSLVIMRLATIEMYFIKYLGASTLYLNGIPFRNNQINVLAHGSTIKADNVETIYYSDIVDKFLAHEHFSKITFEGTNISFAFPGGKLGIRDINVHEESGRLIGLMGASGSGKSTLLNVLNGNAIPSEGNVTINGIDIHQEPGAIEGVIGYVPQDDLLIEELTVYQNLYYAAKLCFSEASEEKLEELVETTLKNLGILEIKSLQVGSPLDKTISGGQRKRVNIGLELLREPAVLFVDEPTSGLSSKDSENIMDLLKELTLRGKLVFVVIHQPSSEIYKMFDRLIILDVGGYQIYYGNPVEAVTYFKGLMDMVDQEQGNCPTCGNVNPEQIFNIIETRILDEYGKSTDERKVSPKKWNQYFLEKYSPRSLPTPEEKPESSLNIPGKIKQAFIFSTRDFLSKIANKQYLSINLLEAPVLALILGFIVRYYPEGNKAGYIFQDNVNIPAFFLMSIIVALFMGLTVSAEEIIKDRKILKREAFLNLSRSSYLVSKLLILFGLSAIQTITFVLVGNYILEINSMTWAYWLILFSTSCFANVLGLNVSATFKSAVTVYIIIPLLLIPQIILSGVVVKFDNLNPTLASKDKVPFVGELMASRWAFEAAMTYQFKFNDFESMFYDYNKTMADADYKKIYLIPKLKSDLRYCQEHYDDPDKSNDPQYTSSITLLRNALQKELAIVGNDQLPEFQNLTISGFNQQVYEATDQFLEVLQQFYINKFNQADQQKNDMIRQMIATPEEEKAFESLRKANQNSQVQRIVRNRNTANRIIRGENKYIRKIDPVYMDPHPDHSFDFRTQFFVPKKYLGGWYWETYLFNCGIIWVMSLILIITLYFEIWYKIPAKLSKMVKP